MTRFLLFFLSAYFLSLSAAQATVISRDWLAPGDGLLTYDTVNQREWLDLTETQLFKFPGETLEEQYQAVLAETLPGGMFEEFIVAAAVDVFALAESAGINTSTLDFDTNGLAAERLVSLLGDPIPGAAPANKWAAGYLGDAVLTSSVAIAYVPSGRSEATAGAGFTNLFRVSNGLWLYRQIPEPTSVTLIALAILIACTTRQKF